MGFMPIQDIRVDRGFADRLPSPGKEEFLALVEDIRRRGVLVDLLLTKERLLLDGHRRLEAAKEAGLSEVPVKILELSGAENWERTVALAVNVYRRHLSEAERANLGSSLLRLERVKAKGRQHEGQERGRQNRTRRELVQDDHHPKPKDEVRATQKVAEAVGVSRQTLERTEAVKAGSPELARRMTDGELSVTAAYNTMKAEELAKRAAAEEKEAGSPGLVTDLEMVYGKYRTVYIDPPVAVAETRAEGNGNSIETRLAKSLEKQCALPLRKLAHNEGCHYWIWSPWTLIRKGVIHRMLDAWELRWVAELIWDQGSSGKGRWFHARTEVLILAVSGDLPLRKSDVAPVISAKREAGSRKPEKFAKLIEEMSVGPRIELFAKHARKGWDTWKGEV